MYIDRIDLVLPQPDIASILAAYSGAEALLEPLPSVSKADRKRYAKLGLKNEALALQIIEVGRANPDLIPRGIDFEMIDRDITARAQLKLLKIQLQRMLSRVDDAMLLLGVDVYAAALSMYHCLRRNADTASLKETVDELRKGFARPSRKKKEEAEAAPAHEPAPAPAPEVQPTPSAPQPPLTVVASQPAPTSPTRIAPQRSHFFHPPQPAPTVTFLFPPDQALQLLAMNSPGMMEVNQHAYTTAGSVSAG